MGVTSPEDNDLAELLVTKGLITRQEADDALNEAGEKDHRLADVLARRELLKPRAITVVEGLTTSSRFGPYDVEGTLGRGAMAIVFKARHRQLGRRVALKVVRDIDEATGALLERFEREAQATARLRHPNIVTVYDAGVVDGVPYIAMDLVDGRTLADILSSGTLTLEQKLKLLVQVARAVDYAHAQGVIHRDLKPANILVDEAGSPRVVDFGLAHLTSGTLTRTGMQLGTPLYMSPEQVRGQVHDVGPHTDVYALGVILYQMLTGRVPYVGMYAQQIYAQLLSRDAIPPRALIPELPLDLQTICLKAIEKEVKPRYRTAADFADDLERWQRGEAIVARPPGLIERTIRFVSRRKGVMAAIAAGLVAVAAVGTFLGLGIVRERTEKERQAEAAAREQKLRDWIAEAKLAYVFGDTPKTEKLVAQVLAESPQHRDGLHWRGRLLLREYQRRRGAPVTRIYASNLVIESPRPETAEEKDLKMRAREAFAGGGGGALAEGILLLWDGNFEGALTKLNEIDERTQGGWEAGFYAGLALYLKGDFAGAGSRLRRYQNMDPVVVCPVLARAFVAKAILGRLMGQKPLAWFQDALTAAERLEDAGEADSARRLAAEVLVHWARWSSLTGETVAEMRESSERRYMMALEKVHGMLTVERGDALLGLAQLQGMRGVYAKDRFDEALSVYAQLIERDPGSAHLHVQRAYLLSSRYQTLSGSGRGDTQDMALARDAFRKALELNPELHDAGCQATWASLHLELSQVQSQGDAVACYHRAIAALTEMIRRRPDRAELPGFRAHVRVMLGCLHQSMGRDPEQDFLAAIEDLKLGMTLDPTSYSFWAALANVRHNLVQVQMRKGVVREEELNAALEAFNKAAEIDPSSSDTFSERGALRLTLAVHQSQKGRDPVPDVLKGIQDFTRSVTLDPMFIEGFQRRAVAYEQAAGLVRDPAEAVRCLEQAAADHLRCTNINDKDVEAWAGLGRVQVALAQREERHRALYDAAIQSFTRAWMASGQKAVAMLVYRGQLYLFRGENDRAVEDLEEAVRRRPELKEQVEPLLRRARGEGE